MISSNYKDFPFRSKQTVTESMIHAEDILITQVTKRTKKVVILSSNLNLMYSLKPKVIEFSKTSYLLSKSGKLVEVVGKSVVSSELLELTK